MGKERPNTNGKTTRWATRNTTERRLVRTERIEKRVLPATRMDVESADAS